MEKWLAPIDGEGSSGISLRNESEFNALQRMMQPQSDVVRDEQNNPVSQSVVSVDWSDVIDRAEKLAKSGRDLRLQVIVTRAMANLESFAGLAVGLGLMTDTLERYWDDVHPQLRKASTEKEAALRRINALFQLQNDDAGLLRDLKDATAMNPRGIGPITNAELAVSLRSDREMLANAAPGLSKKETNQLTENHQLLVKRVKAACMATSQENPDDLEALKKGLSAATKALQGFEALVSDKLSSSFSLLELSAFLQAVSKTLAATGENTAKANAPVEEIDSDLVTKVTADQHVHEVGLTDKSNSRSSPPTELKTREDVRLCLEKIIEFYARKEPSSPIPLLIQRIHRMVPMDFVELMQEIAPGGLKEFNSVAGTPPSKDK